MSEWTRQPANSILAQWKARQTQAPEPTPKIEAKPAPATPKPVQRIVKPRRKPQTLSPANHRISAPIIDKPAPVQRKIKTIAVAREDRGTYRDLLSAETYQSLKEYEGRKTAL